MAIINRVRLIMVLFVVTFLINFLTYIPNVVFGCASGESDTGIGCIPYDPGGFTKKISGIIVGVAGGIALLLLLIGSIQFISSSGDPDGIDEAKQKISAAVSGILFIIFSVLILKVIGIDILGLDQLGILIPSGSGVTTP